MVARKHHTKEFKLDAISLVLDQGYTATAVSWNLGINASMLRRWMRESQRDDAGQAFRGNGKLTPEQEEIRKLKIQIKRLEMEKRILKEATVFFVKEMK
ncbi:transposase [Nitrosomonas mobilis]|uniref:Transposase n=1 Tax=Nitrosomonas mobilis TaxID=51642 RepID=A0A1G5SAB4_9PROT|nr:transposase [Nitrosomonas mobilis]